MSGNITSKNILDKNTERFQAELKLFVNQRLYDKKKITEEMYCAAKEILLKKAC